MRSFAPAPACPAMTSAGLIRDGYDILAIETRHLDEGDLTTIIWEREDGPDAIPEAELPFDS